MMRRASARCGASSMTPSICTTPVALASNAASTRSAPRRGAGAPSAFSDGVRPISTLHGVVFAILRPAQPSTPSGTRRRQCFAPRSEDVRDCDLLLEAGQHADHQDPTADLRGFDRLLHGFSGRPRDRLRSFMPKFQTCTALHPAWCQMPADSGRPRTTRSLSPGCRASRWPPSTDYLAND